MADDTRVMSPRGLDRLITVLEGRGYAVVAPVVRTGSISIGEVHGADQLPWGVRDEQAPGHYRLTEAEDGKIFGQAAAAQGMKSVLFGPDELIWRGRRSGSQFEVTQTSDGPVRPTAFLGVRGCDLRALAQHDRVLAERAFPDARYVRRRDGAFIAAVTCTDPGGTCFCTSMGGGPHPDQDYDLALTELVDPHRFVVEVGTDLGAEVLAEVETDPATTDDLTAVTTVVAEASGRMGRSMQTDGLRDLLYGAAESPVWDDLASRCLSCMNCTMVCPTCFCTTVADVSVLGSDDAERRRVWDSCFSEDFAHIHGGSLRTEVRSRYRQWLTHKLAAWQDQFDALGCVGCGRCVTWCPVGIDLTVEVAKIRAGAGMAMAGGPR